MQQQAWHRIVPVVALEGDGALLMQPGCLATVNALQPANLMIAVFGNRRDQAGPRRTGPSLIAPAIDDKPALGTTERFPTRIGDRLPAVASARSPGSKERP